MTALLELRGLTVELPTTLRSASGGSGQALGWVRPVNDVSLRLERGAALGLVGESGSGKTMLALALMGLLPAGARVSGSALYHAVQGSLASEASRDSSVDLAALGEDEWGGIRGRRIAMVFQEPMTALNPVMRVGAQIAEAVRVHQKGLSRDEV